MITIPILTVFNIVLGTLSYLTFIKLRKDSAKIRNFGVLCLSALLAGFAILLFQYIMNLAYIRYVANANSLNDITLNDTVSDVVFLLGEPDKVDPWNELERYTYGKSPGSGIFYVFFDEDKVARLHWDCLTYSVIGVSCRQDAKEVIGLLGQPQSTSSSEDKTKRIYNYPTKNLSIFLKKGIVTGFSIARKSELKFTDSND